MVLSANKLGLFVAAALACGAAPLERLEYVEPHMGTLFRITLYAANKPAARAASDEAFARVKALDGMLSDYKPESELSRLTTHAAGEWVPVSDDLFHVLRASLTVSRSTGGAFDVTAGPVVRIWREARKTRSLPSQAAILSALASTGYRNIELDARRRAVRTAIQGMQLDFGAVAKGYAAEEALKILRQRGYPRAMVAASGDLALGEPPPGTNGWRISIEPSETGKQILTLRNCGVSTSGDTNQFAEIGGKRYSHIIDARNGQALAESRGVTVIAKRSMDADALATAACILGKPIAHRRARYFH